MNNEINEVSLGELAAPGKSALATGPFGSAVSSKNFVVAGVPMIRGSNLSEDVGIRLADDELVFVPSALADRFTRSLARKGDLVFTCWGTVGQIGLVDSRARFDTYLVSNKQMKMTPDPARVDSLFLYYYLSQAHMIDQVKGQAIGSSVPGFNLGQLRALTVKLPQLARQRAIGEALGALDDKIVANLSLVTAAETLAAGLFDSLPSTVSRPLSDLGDFVNGKAFTKGATGSGRVVVRIAELNSGLGGSTVYNDIEVAERHLARPGDLLFAWSGSLTVRRWYRAEAIINQHIFKVIPKLPTPMWLMNQVLQRRLLEFKLIAADKATTMGHIQRRHLDVPVSLPSAEDIAKIDPLMTSLWLRALAAEQETLLLEELRDTLLPLLMSGRLRVRDAEMQVEDVV